MPSCGREVARWGHWPRDANTLLPRVQRGIRRLTPASVVAPDQSVPRVLTVQAKVTGRWLLQLMYTPQFWPRLPAHAYHLRAGRFGGLLWRVTLPETEHPWLTRRFSLAAASTGLFQPSGCGRNPRAPGKSPLLLTV